MGIEEYKINFPEDSPLSCGENKLIYEIILSVFQFIIKLL